MDILVHISYLVSAVLFILALRGLSHPETARRGLTYGMSGMALAIITTLLSSTVDFGFIVLLGIAVGGGIGAYIAKKIEMTSLPELMAGFHSLVGLSAVFVAAAAFYNPIAYGIGQYGDINLASLIEMSLGAAIGAVTFTEFLLVDGNAQKNIGPHGSKQVFINTTEFFKDFERVLHLK